MKNIIIAGVGGQGTLLAANILGHYALKKGYDVKLSEVHGMAQRGGSVVTYVRIGDEGEKVHNPLIDEKQTDILLAFEILEGLRWINHAKQDGAKLYGNVQQILPMPVITGAEAYPKDIETKIKKRIPNSVFLDALSAAEQAGSGKAVNTVLLGVLARDIDPDIDLWNEVLEETIKPKFLELNKKAFLAGFNYIKENSN